MKYDKEANKIFDYIQKRLNELIDKSERKELNSAYLISFEIAIKEDIKDALEDSQSD